MSLKLDFLQASDFPDLFPSGKLPKRRQSPFSIRLTGDERARLVAEAKGVPLGTYLKAKVLGDAAIRIRRAGIAIEDKKALGQALALLGKSALVKNLSVMAEAASSGSLPVTPETEAEIVQAARDVSALRYLLLLALGLKEAAP